MTKKFHKFCHFQQSLEQRDFDQLVIEFDVLTRIKYRNNTFI